MAPDITVLYRPTLSCQVLGSRLHEQKVEIDEDDGRLNGRGQSVVGIQQRKAVREIATAKAQIPPEKLIRIATGAALRVLG